MSISQPHKILLITATLGGGGAERALVNIINHLDRKRFQPHLALFQKKGAFLTDLDLDVLVYEIQPQSYGFLHRNWTRMRAIKQLCSQLHPALLMSVQWQVNSVTMLADRLLKLECPIIVNEQNAPTRKLKSVWQGHLFWPLARKTYRRAAKVVTISSGIAAELQDKLALPPDRFHVIHNPVSLALVSEQSVRPSAVAPATRPYLVAVGRLTKQKNYPFLLHAMSKVTKEEPAHLYILGEGSERPYLEKLIHTLNLEPYVRLLGFQNNPFALMRQADIFVLASDFEGFGNVIVEAMALGTPVIATDCPYGPGEILDGGKYGMLVPTGDVQAMAKAILALLRDQSARLRLAAKGRERAKSFAAENIVAQYEQLFQNLIDDQLQDHNGR